MHASRNSKTRVVVSGNGTTEGRKTKKERRDKKYTQTTGVEIDEASK
jgi:hypothetical protein